MSGAVWNRVRFNAARQTSRRDPSFRSPLSEAFAGLRCAFVADPRIEGWQILPVTGHAGLSQAMLAEFNLDIPGLDVAVGANTIFQSLHTAEIKPGQDYLLWFSFKDDKPVEIDVTLRLVPPVHRYTRLTSVDIARQLGLELPFQYKTQSGRALRTVKAVKHGFQLVDLDFSPDGKFLATVGGDRIVKVWDLSTDEVVATLSGSRVKFSADGKLVATLAPAEDLRAAILWDGEKFNRLFALTGGHLLEPRHMAFTPRKREHSPRHGLSLCRDRDCLGHADRERIVGAAPNQRMRVSQCNRILIPQPGAPVSPSSN